MRPTLYPLRCDGPGRLSTIPRPRGGDSLDEEMDGLRTQGVDVLVAALSIGELVELDLTGESDAAGRAGLEFVALPIRDRGVPEAAVVLPVLTDLAANLRMARPLEMPAHGVGTAREPTHHHQGRSSPDGRTAGLC
jgi:hypothetical protein